MCRISMMYVCVWYEMQRNRAPTHKRYKSWASRIRCVIVVIVLVRESVHAGGSCEEYGE